MGAAEEKSMKFSLRIIRMYKYLNETKHEFIMTKQLVRAGTSVSANIVEAEKAVSKREFLSKMYIAYKECSETAHWITLLYNSEYITDKEYESIYSDCDELRKILSSITKTTRENLEKTEKKKSGNKEETGVE